MIEKLIINYQIKNTALMGGILVFLWCWLTIRLANLMFTDICHRLLQLFLTMVIHATTKRIYTQ
ncbi:hypothetical protein [Moraxella lacunata]|uniref:Uncharacterized protein n=1 Tax=Moraxella lacunata TaxID=477 RepID=A0A1B8PV96_MORLA|nr:hypothetical protein A9309_12020 [Moraxella lacunata]OBX61645.1 hypothetical protein A9Z63_07675 [Moraxella lacunata]